MRAPTAPALGCVILVLASCYAGINALSTDLPNNATVLTTVAAESSESIDEGTRSGAYAEASASASDESSQSQASASARANADEGSFLDPSGAHASSSASSSSVDSGSLRNALAQAQASAQASSANAQPWTNGFGGGNSYSGNGDQSSAAAQANADAILNTYSQPLSWGQGNADSLSIGPTYNFAPEQSSSQAQANAQALNAYNPPGWSSGSSGDAFNLGTGYNFTPQQVNAQAAAVAQSQAAPNALYQLPVNWNTGNVDEFKGNGFKGPAQFDAQGEASSSVEVLQQGNIHYQTAPWDQLGQAPSYNAAQASAQALGESLNPYGQYEQNPYQSQNPEYGYYPSHAQASALSASGRNDYHPVPLNFLGNNRQYLGHQSAPVFTNPSSLYQPIPYQPENPNYGYSSADAQADAFSARRGFKPLPERILSDRRHLGYQAAPTNNYIPQHNPNLQGLPGNPSVPLVYPRSMQIPISGRRFMGPDYPSAVSNDGLGPRGFNPSYLPYGAPEMPASFKVLPESLNSSPDAVHSRVVPENELVYPFQIPGAFNSVVCSRVSELHFLWSPTEQCLVCTCDIQLRPVCARCGGCRRPDLPLPPPQPTIPPKREPDEFVPIEFSTPAPIEPPATCSPLPTNSEFTNPLNPCQVCVCSQRGYRDVRITCQESPQCVVPANAPTVPPMPVPKEPVPLPSCSRMPANVPFPHPTDRCVQCRCVTSVVPAGPRIVCRPSPECELFPPPPESPARPPDSFFPIPSRDLVEPPGKPEVPSPVPTDGVIPYSNMDEDSATAEASSDEFPLSALDVPTPAPSFETISWPSVTVAPFKRGPLPGPPPHESCRPFQPDVPFDHPWDECRVCVCSEFRAMGRVTIEVDCYTKPECCVEGPPSIKKVPPSNSLGPPKNQLRILDKMCEFKSFGAEFVADADGCRVCTCELVGSFVVPVCRRSPTERCANGQVAPFDGQIVFLEPRCRMHQPLQKFPVGCYVCACQAVFNYVVAKCSRDPNCGTSPAVGVLSASAQSSALSLPSYLPPAPVRQPYDTGGFQRLQDFAAAALASAQSQPGARGNGIGFYSSQADANSYAYGDNANVNANAIANSFGSSAKATADASAGLPAAYRPAVPVNTFSNPYGANGNVAGNPWKYLFSSGAHADSYASAKSNSDAWRRLTGTGTQGSPYGGVQAYRPGGHGAAYRPGALEAYGSGPQGGAYGSGPQGAYGSTNADAYAESHGSNAIAKGYANGFYSPAYLNAPQAPLPSYYPYSNQNNGLQLNRLESSAMAKGVEYPDRYYQYPPKVSVAPIGYGVTYPSKLQSTILHALGPEFAKFTTRSDAEAQAQRTGEASSASASAEATNGRSGLSDLDVSARCAYAGDMFHDRCRACVCRPSPTAPGRLYAQCLGQPCA